MSITPIQFGDEHASQFAATAARVLAHLSASSPLQSWMLVRTDGPAPVVLATADPTGTVAAHDVLTDDPSLRAPHRVNAPVSIANEVPFAQVIGFGTLENGSLPEVHRDADLFANVLAALATGEMMLAAERRAIDLRNGSTDPLTGLATRQGWEVRLRRDERFCAAFGETAAVLVVELDDLKRSNELYGHSVGDEQIRIAGDVLRDTLAGRHFAARVTGDRLGVLMIGVSEHEIGELERVLRHAFSVADLSTTIGTARRTPDAGLAGALAAAEQEVLDTAAARQNVQTDANEAAVLLAALERGEISAYFQPIVDLRTGDVVALEALARWHSPDGMREPDRFLRAMKEAGLLGALFDRILDDGLARLKEFRSIVPGLQLAVNVEFDAAVETTLFASVSRCLAAHDLPASALSIELSERQTFELSAAIRTDLTAVADLGVRLMLDDFGTGFASLETLTTLPISGVKLDRKFTGQVIDGEREPVVVKAMVALAAEAGLTVVAEGIETQVQCDRLVRMGCRLGQGYLFALPQPADAVAVVLSAPLVSTF